MTGCGDCYEGEVGGGWVILFCEKHGGGSQTIPYPETDTGTDPEDD